jgi:hypothetical protein
VVNPALSAVAGADHARGLVGCLGHRAISQRDKSAGDSPPCLASRLNPGLPEVVARCAAGELLRPAACSPPAACRAPWRRRAAVSPAFASEMETAPLAGGTFNSR